MLDLRALEAFVWVARLGQFRAAARKLHVTQPAISTRIASLEQALGVRLFERKAPQVALTAKGKELLVHAERMLELRETLRIAANQKVAVRGPFRLGVSDTLVHTWFPRLVTRINAAFPLLTLEFHVDVKPNMMRALLARQLDIAFVTEPVNEGGLRKLHLNSDRLAWIASRKLGLPPGPLPLSAVAERPIITYGRNSRPYIAIQDLLAAQGLAGRIYTSSSISTTVTLIKRGIGIGAIPTIVVAPELRQGVLRALDVKSAPLPDFDWIAAYPAGPDSLVAATIAELARAAAAEGAPGTARTRRRKRAS